MYNYLVLFYEEKMNLKNYYNENLDKNSFEKSKKFTDEIINIILDENCFYLIKYLYKLKHKFGKQSKQIINLYLDKKFICKLLSLFTVFHKTIELRTILDEVLDYFYLDFISLYITKQDKIISCNSLAMNELYTKNDIKLRFCRI